MFKDEKGSGDMKIPAEKEEKLFRTEDQSSTINDRIRIRFRSFVSPREHSIR